jgi:hypothetical protein
MRRDSSAPVRDASEANDRPRASLCEQVRRLLLVIACCVGWPHPSHADDAPRGDDTWAYDASGALEIGAGLIAGSPAALSTGLGLGVGVGITKTAAGMTWGARAGWAVASESTLEWAVRHDDFPLRVTGGLTQVAGRGAFGLRLGIGATLVHEARVRNRGMREGRSGSELENSRLMLLPAVDLDAVIGLHVAGRWLMTLTGGPSCELLEGKLHAGWNAQLGVAWQP